MSNVVKEYDVVVLPEKRVHDLAIATSQELAEFKHHFLLGEETCVPHSSLYMLTLDDKHLSEACTRLASIAQEAMSINMEATHYDMGAGYYGIEYARPQDAVTLQMQIIEALLPLRGGLDKTTREFLDVLEGAKKENVEKYGYTAIGDEQKPHITFTRFLKNEEEAHALVPEVSEFSGAFTRLGLFEMGEHGTCVKEVKAWELGV